MTDALKPIEPPDSHRLSAAQGWLELGNLAEARAELESLQPDSWAHPAVLEVWWLVCVHSRDWTRALEVAERETIHHPDSPAGYLHRAYALRRVKEGGLPAAWETLRPAYERFPNEPVVAFNLACYACQLGKLDEARQWLERAMAVGGQAEIRTMALRDEDLKPLWPELRSPSQA